MFHLYGGGYIGGEKSSPRSSPQKLDWGGVEGGKDHSSFKRSVTPVPGGGGLCNVRRGRKIVILQMVGAKGLGCEEERQRLMEVP